MPGVACLAHLIGFPDIRSRYAFAIALKSEIKPPVLWLVDAMPLCDSMRGHPTGSGIPAARLRHRHVVAA